MAAPEFERGVATGVQAEADREQGEERCEHELGVDAGVGVQHEIAEPSAGADPFADDHADGRADQGNADAAGDLRARVGDADVPKQALVTGAEAARGHQHDFGGALDAIVAIDNHWEEDYQCRHQDFRRHAVTEPEHQQRR